MTVEITRRPTPRRIVHLVAAAAAAGALATACATTEASGAARDETPDAAAATVTVNAESFAPIDLEVTQGTTVTWVWGGGIAHDVSGEGFSSPIQTDGEFQHLFDEVGIYPYRCNLHAGMAGTIKVVEP